MNLFKREIQIPIMLKSKLQKEMSKLIASSDNSADKILSICEHFYNKPANNMEELKNRNLKVKGDIFEYFCQLYMKKCYKLKKVWLLNEVPDNIKKELNLNKNDFGIDLVGIDYNDRYYAIQAKYRKRNSDKKTSITWKQLSTFYALCARTGPFYKHIVFTTANYVRRIGKKDEKDVTIGFSKLSKINHFDWINMCDEVKIESVKNSPKKLTLEALREKRLEFYSN